MSLQIQTKIIYRLVVYQQMKNGMKKFLVGCGSFGSVYRFPYQGRLYALKKIRVRDNIDFDYCVNQIQILQRLPRHLNIVGYVGHQLLKQTLQIYIAMEYIQGQSLGQIISHQKANEYSEEQITNWIMQICLALKHLKKHNIIHRDLKPDNIMLNKHGNIKLIDFGLSQKISQKCNLTAKVGTPMFMSPQMCQKNYSHQSDIWSLGVTLYQFVNKKYPFQNEIKMKCQIMQFDRQKNMIQNLDKSVFIESYKRIITYLQQLIIQHKIICKTKFKRLDKLINSMLIKDPEQRISLEKILSFPQILKHYRLFALSEQKQQIEVPKNQEIQKNNKRYDLLQDNPLRQSGQLLLRKQLEQQSSIDKVPRYEQDGLLDMNRSLMHCHGISLYQAILMSSRESCHQKCTYFLVDSVDLQKTKKLESLNLGLRSNLKQTRQ